MNDVVDMLIGLIRSEGELSRALMEVRFGRIGQAILLLIVVTCLVELLVYLLARKSSIWPLMVFLNVNFSLLGGAIVLATSRRNVLFDLLVLLLMLLACISIVASGRIIDEWRSEGRGAGTE